MLNKFLGIVAIAALCLLIAGCKTHVTTIDTAKTNSTYIVVVGMENSKFAGDCPGAGYDADRMYKLLSSYTSNAVLLRDSTATKFNVVSALVRAVENAKDGLVIFCYSGHGGSEPFFDTGKEELDGKDEFLCLYDTYLRDNEIWDIIGRSKGRVFIIADCCHSATMYRAPGFKVIPPLAYDATIDDSDTFSMLCWSGCPDNTYSYGSTSGGQFTNALLRHFNANKTYEKLWEEIKSDKTLRSFENPQSTVMGDGFKGKAVFR